MTKKVTGVAQKFRDVPDKPDKVTTLPGGDPHQSTTSLFPNSSTHTHTFLVTSSGTPNIFFHNGILTSFHVWYEYQRHTKLNNLSFLFIQYFLFQQSIEQTRNVIIPTHTFALLRFFNDCFRSWIPCRAYFQGYPFILSRIGSGIDQQNITQRHVSLPPFIFNSTAVKTKYTFASI